MKRYVLHLRFTAEQCLDYYRGGVKHALGRAATGEMVQFPASLLRAHVTEEGVRGRFALLCDEDHSNSRLERLE